MSADSQRAVKTGAISAITLYSGGVAEVVRQAAVSGDETITMTVPVDQVNDVLKSLVVRNPGGGVAQVSLEGSVKAREFAHSARFQPADLASLPQLLRKLKGARIRIEGDHSVTGIVLGVAPEQVKPLDDKATTPLAIVTVLADDGQVRSLPIVADTALEVLDEKTDAALKRAAAGLSNSLSDDTRQVAVTVDGTGKRTVELDYVVAAPVWKSSHRLVIGPDGKGRLQSWAVIENATGQDWSEVKVQLSSGSPVTLRQNLYDPYFTARPAVPVFVDRQGVPAADRGDVPSLKMARAPAQADRSASVFADHLMREAPPVPAAEFSMGAASNVGKAVEGDVSVTYPLPQPVTLAAGSTLSVPIVDADVPAERIAVLTPGDNVIHPRAAVSLDNATGAALPAGIVTVYDASGYVGDSTLLPVPAGQSRQVQFALDRKITVNTIERPTEMITDLKVVDGVLHYKWTQEQKTIYAAANSGADARKLVIAHPKLAGWQLKSAAKIGESDDAYRLAAQVPAHGRAEIEAVDQQAGDEGFALVDADQAQLLRFSKAASDPAMAAELGELAAIQAKKADLERQIDRVNAEKSDIFAAQDRIRENIKAVGEGDLRDRYLSEMRQQEDRLAKIDGQIAGLKSERDRIAENLRRKIRAM
ncbi:hypothetical protein LQ948_08815 [Jiella sp. MQZ9-1]|uniref:DUF4139 domain-containing protein n=1 Tax=Jiella flava TaxID=2816857 RepID=A0A939JU88_9HYPH|nr:DUF4139 domain-containing protein [Jiella flava]MBO0662930.1 hypothetical protein [Jiella flava]MCD2471310.1 hypothetical protein [Jiella flava]